MIRSKSRYFWKKPDVQCSLIEPDQTNPEQPPFYVLVFRGTNEPTDWITNFNAFLKPWKSGGLVHEGFMNAFLQIWPDIEEVIRGVDHPIYYTGHSLGAALATLAASSLPPNVLYTFGSPRVGNRQFVETMADLPVFRFVNDHDVVPTVPPSMAMCPFVHVGKPYRLANDVHLEIGNGEVGNREQPLETELDSTTLMEKMLNPPGILADHAPVNYVARIERVLKNIKARVSTGF
ncbi:MAG TPA: lipase family protein [Verrucomicrobiales bacterium]|nr:lipase family protein [Verrucomicrobiales bacterium]